VILRHPDLSPFSTVSHSFPRAFLRLLTTESKQVGNSSPLRAALIQVWPACQHTPNAIVPLGSHAETVSKLTTPPAIPFADASCYDPDNRTLLASFPYIISVSSVVLSTGSPRPFKIFGRPLTSSTTPEHPPSLIL